MSQLTDFAENKLVDMVRAQAWSLGASLYAGLASAAADGSITEITFTGYSRVAISRALASWAGTQASGSTTASSGTSHASSNNAAINFGTAASAGSAVVSHLVLFDAATAGNAICFIPLPGGALTIANGDPVSFAAGTITFTLGLAGGCTHYLANKLIDFVFRGQAFSFPATMYKALFTAAPSNAGGGTEAAHTAYARVGVTTSLANFAGTQGAGTTVASTGTSGKTSNNIAIAFASPGSSGPAITHDGWVDASTGGNLLFWAPLNTARSIVSGAAGPVYNAGASTITFQ